MRAALYDFKRSFLRLSTLGLLAAFVALGAGLGYLTASSLTQRERLFGVQGYAAANATSGEVSVRAFVYDFRGEPVARNSANLTAYICSPGEHGYSCSPYARKELAGGPSLEASLPLPPPPSGPQPKAGMIPTVNVELTISNALGSSWFAAQLPLPQAINATAVCSPIGQGPIAHLLPEGGQARPGLYLLEYEILPSDGGFRLAATLVPHDCDFSGAEGAQLFIYPFNGTMPSPQELLREGRAVPLGLLPPGATKIFSANLSLSGWTQVAFLVRLGSGEVYAGAEPIPPGLASRRDVASELLVAYAVSSAPLASFYPIALLYLAYLLIAKPKATGALEFLLARPVTRLQIYLNRFAAGALVAAAASALSVLATSATTALVIGVALPARDSALLALGLWASMTSFYSVFYMLSAALKRGWYLGLSVALYLIFTLLWQPLVLIGAYLAGVPGALAFDVLYASYYFNPSAGLQAAYQALVDEHGLTMAAGIAWVRPGAFSVPLGFASAACWIAAPLALGWLAFRRANLYVPD